MSVPLSPAGTSLPASPLPASPEVRPTAGGDAQGLSASRQMTNVSVVRPEAACALSSLALSSPVSSPVSSPEQGTVREGDLPSEATCCTPAQERARAIRFVAPDTEAICCGGGDVAGLICSPDSRLLALCSDGSGQSRYVNIWQQEATGIRWLGGSRHDDDELSCLTFSADSRSLSCVGRWGEISQWQQRATPEGDRWHKTGSFNPLEEFVAQARLSADGRWLAAVLEGANRRAEVGVFKETAPDVWQQQGRWACRSRQGTKPERRLYDEMPLHSEMVFSGQARRLFFADACGLRAFCRDGDAWQELRLEPDILPDAGPVDIYQDSYRLVVDDGGNSLAAVRVIEEVRAQGHEQGGERDDSLYLRCHRLLQVWHFGHNRWQPVARRSLVDVDSRRGVAMAFSPDGQQLAFKEKDSQGRRLCILSDLAPGGPGSTTWLHPGPVDRPGKRGDYSPDFLQFSATGRQLATWASDGVQIWQRALESQTWSSVLWQPRVGYGACELALSPDGFHCALSAGDGKVSVWGFGGDPCLKKLEWQENTSVDALVFTPDGASLAVASQGPMTPYDDYTAARLRCLRLVPECCAEETTAATGDTRPESSATDAAKDAA